MHVSHNSKMDQQLPHISNIILAFNEIHCLETVVREIHAALVELGCSFEIIIVDDGSSDGTGGFAEQLAEALNNIRVIHHETNQGLGAGYRTGFEQAQGDFIIFFPADGQFPAMIIKQFIPFMDSADMVLGYLPYRKSSLVAKFLSRIEKLVYRLLFGPLPKFQGVLMFKQFLLDEIELKSTGRGWAVLMELIIRTSKAGYNIVSVPTEMRLRMSGSSKVNNLPTIWANVKQIIALIRYL